MPAVELLRLRAQIRTLASRFDDPLAFRDGLKDMLDQHSNRAYRPGTAVKPQPLLPSYRVAPLIMRELELEFSRLCREQPETALKTSEVIWQDTYLETRLLATTLLGAIPSSLGRSVVNNIRAWAKPDENFRMLDTLFQNGTVTLRRSEPALLLSLAQDWLESSNSAQQALGIRLMIPLVQDNEFNNLPPVFRLISPLVQHVPGALQTDLQAILETLAKRSPTETIFFLRQSLSAGSDPTTARMIRRLLPLFEPTQQAILKAAMQIAK